MLAQLLHHCLVGGRTEVFRARDMGLCLGDSKAHINEEWSFAFGQLESFGEVLRVDEIGGRDWRWLCRFALRGTRCRLGWVGKD